MHVWEWEKEFREEELTMISYIQDDPPMILDISKVIKVH